MNEHRLARALADLTGSSLAAEIASEFVKIRRDCATKTLERASPGKFVERFVQCLQHIASGKHEDMPSIESYLTAKVEQESALPEGLRLCGSRIARSMYTLRNKRNIAHTGTVDPNSYDLAYLHQGAAWIMAEMIRNSSGATMEEAGALIELVNAPIGTLVEEIDGTRLVHANASVRVKILILLHSWYPAYVDLEDIQAAIDHRDSKSTSSRLSELRKHRLIFGTPQKGYRLTSPGYAAAIAEIARLQ